MFVRLRFTLLLLCTLALCHPADAYSLLTHEELIDLAWQSSIVPLLLSRYPGLTPAELEHARAYAYGGCVIQDIGYYPFGDAFVSNLTHYVRSGDLVVNLFRDAANADELAFAVGALSHYIGDSAGYSEATNLAVPIEFPRLRDKYGNVVAYAEGKHQHVQTEFAFDINEIAHHRLAPVHYLRHVGLEVPVKQLALAFYQTYGLSEDFTAGRKQRVNVGAYRFAVHRLIPRIAYALTLLHRNHEPADRNSPELRQLQSEIAIVEKENQWAKYRRHAGLGTYAVAGLIFVLPKIGPLKLLAIKGPTTHTEAEYIHSVVQSSNQLNRTLRRFTPPPGAPLTARAGAAQSSLRQRADPRHPLPNLDLDTGSPVRPSGYRLTDDTYATLAHRLAANPQQPISPEAREDILAYYANPDLPFATRKDPQAWAALQQDLAVLRTMPTSTEPPPFTTYDDEEPLAGAAVPDSSR
ncbi:MAG: zinc dependent phospholipase C family protein [Acidobacteriaceae bacterium]